MMGVVGRKERTELVEGLYRLEMGVMGLGCLEVLLTEKKSDAGE